MFALLCAVPVLLSAGKVRTIYPLHDRDALSSLLDQWVRGMTPRQPLDAVAQYFGTRVALYFAWLGHYTTALLFPALVGLFFWVLLPTRVRLLSLPPPTHETKNIESENLLLFNLRLPSPRFSAGLKCF